MSVMLFFSHNLIKDWAIEALKMRMQETTRTIGLQVEKYINLYIQPIKKLSEKSEIKSMDWAQQKEIIQQETTLEYLALAIVTPEGKAYYADGSTLDLSDRGYIQKAFNGEFNISPVIRSRATDNDVMMIAQPILKEKETVGVIIARIEPEFLKDFMTSDNSDSYNIYYALDEQGNVMLHSENKFQLEQYNFLKFDEKSYGLKGFEKAIEESYQLKDGFGSYEKNNDKVIISYSTISGLDWKFFVGFYEKSILASIRALDAIFFMLAGILITIIVIIAWFITRSFVEPVLELSSLFKRAAKGELTVRSTYNKDDELGEAARSFNQMMEQIKTLTYFDPVTNLPNEQVLYADFKEIIHKNDQKKNIMVIEFSDFSRINQIYGYQVGDEVLKILAERIQQTFLIDGKLYRGKGDQFILLFEDHNGMLLSEKIIRKINEPIHLENKMIKLSGRIGISEHPKDGETIETLVKKAIFANNYLKKKAIGHIQIFEEKLYDKDLEIREMINKISEALDENLMYLDYQPIYDLKTKTIQEVEALIRWHDPIKGNISPGEFIPIAERNGLIKTLDHWVIESVFQQMKSWKAQGSKPVICSINVSAETFESTGFEAFLTEMSLKNKINPNLIQIELTERTLLNDIDTSIEKFKKLRKKGFKIAIDDFGIGYSSLSYLVKLPIDNLKIDQSFIMNIGSGDDAKIIISTLVTMAKQLNVEVIAEGIETQEELDYLLGIHCNKGQGFYLDRPLNIQDITDLLNVVSIS